MIEQTAEIVPIRELAAMRETIERLTAKVEGLKCEAVRGLEATILLKAEVERLQGCLNGRDEFIVNRGLWGAFVKDLKRSYQQLSARSEDGE